MTRICTTATVIGLSMLATSLAGSPRRLVAQNPGRTTFSSADAASDALAGAVANDDRQALTHILGGGASLISTGDDSQDEADRQVFVDKYRQMHRLVTDTDGNTVLLIGAENWPFPVRLAHKGSRWFFDADAGGQEVLARRIGDNELRAIQACLALVEAEKEYATTSHDGDGVPQYAPRLVSEEGTHDGLYSPAPDGNGSPIGPLLANAGGAPGSTPFHGYYFRVLDGQGPHARGGAKRYDVNGKMTGGFAFIAYPAEYRSSGVMTFIVNDDGVVYERDLGPRTAAVATAMQRYDPSKVWRKVQ